MNRSKAKALYKFRLFLMAVLVFFMQGCVTPPPADPLAYKSRTKSSVNEDVTVTVAVPTIAEAQAHILRLWQTPIRYNGKPVWGGAD